MHDNRTQQLVYVRKGSCQVRGGDFDTLDGNKVERRYVHIRCLWDSFKHTRLRQLLMPLDGIKF